MRNENVAISFEPIYGDMSEVLWFLGHRDTYLKVGDFWRI